MQTSKCEAVGLLVTALVRLALVSCACTTQAERCSGGWVIPGLPGTAGQLAALLGWFELAIGESH